MTERPGIDPALRHTPLTDILVVDDLPEKLLVYRTVLESPELNIVTARSGQDALRAVLQHEFAVILLDVNMPGMDGFETARLIRQRKRSSSTPIIFITAFNDDMRMIQGYASGAVDYMPTPVVPDILRAKVQVFVELFRMRRLGALQAEERAKRASAEMAAERSAFLSETGAALTRSLDLHALFTALAQAPVPLLADLCVLFVTDAPGRTGGYVCTWASANDAERASFQGCPFPWLQKMMERAVSTDQSRVIEIIPPSANASIADLPDVDGGRAIVLPLNARQGTHGALAFLRGAASAAYHTDDVALARELVSRAGIALENVMLVQGIQEADRRKDEFLGMLAHELRNPLAPLRNAVDILDMAENPDPLLERARDVIDRQVTHMTRLVDDLLDATRIARGKVLLRKEDFDMSTIVRQTAADYRSIFQRSRHLFNVDVPGTPLYMHGDPTRLAQTVGNLLHNAHKFTDPGGTVTLRLATDPNGEWAELSVVDTGMGIEPAVLPHVFDVFRQADQGLDRSRGGLGLGLTLVKGLVELHNGTVEAMSEGAGQGTRFTVRLPLHQGPAPAIVEVRPLAENVRKHRVLIIDDNRDAAESIKLLLEHEGHQARTAHTGPTGLESVHSFKPEVIICDIGLPGMDGYQIARSVRESFANDPIYLIALTGYGRDEDRVRSREAGFAMHMTKPIDLAMLRSALARVAATENV